MALKDWSTSAGDNDDADPGINWLENQPPSTVNNSARAMMAEIRTWYDAVEWRDWGHSVTRITNTTFTVTGDVTAIYTTNRPIKCVDSSTLYGFVASSSYSAPDTTVTVTLDSGNLSASLSSVELGYEPSTKQIHVSSVRNAADVTANNNFSGTLTNTSTDAGAAAGPVVTLDRNSASPAASDVIGAIDGVGRDSGGNSTTYYRLQGEIVDPTDTSEDGRFVVQTVLAGSLGDRLTVEDGIQLGAPTGGNVADSVNISGNYLIDGSTVANKVLLQSGNLNGSALSTIDITDIPATYDIIELHINGLVTGSAAKLAFRVSTNNGSTFYAGGTDYEWRVDSTQTDGTGNNDNNTLASAVQLSGLLAGDANGGHHNLTIMMRNFGLGVLKNISFEGGYRCTSGNWCTVNGTGVCKNATAISSAVDAIRLFPSVGNFPLVSPSAKWYLYGYKNP